MVIYDENNNIVKDPDLKIGFLKNEKKIVHHDAVPSVEEQCHYKVIAEYPNGGKDVEKIIDVEEIQGNDSYDEEISIQKYVLYTKEELEEKERIKSLPTDESRLQAMEDALMQMMLGGTSGVKFLEQHVQNGTCHSRKVKRSCEKRIHYGR
jgi:hypothetical protein